LCCHAASATDHGCRYSSNKDISRARQAFFSGKKAFLLVTERFHFYRRCVVVFAFSLPGSPAHRPARSYVLRGAQTLVFYALPERPSFYAEFLSFPFAPRQARAGAAAEDDDEEPELDAADVSVLAAYSRYDLMRLQRIVGSAQAQRMVTEEKSNWRFT
jgi:U3 small nucleolar RNA-associated protein 25